jgi:hypothetical protein
LKERLIPGGVADAVLAEGELRFLVNGRPVIERVFVATEEAELILAQWRLIGRELSITDNTRPERLTRDLRTLVVDPTCAAAQQILALDMEIQSLDEEIVRLEREMEDILSELYGVTPDERTLIEAG